RRECPAQWRALHDRPPSRWQRTLTAARAVCERAAMDEAPGLRITSRIAIPWREIQLSYARSGGPGGQNVNKVASKAVLRFDLRGSPSLPAPARERALARLAAR